MYKLILSLLLAFWMMPAVPVWGQQEVHNKSPGETVSLTDAYTQINLIDAHRVLDVLPMNFINNTRGYYAYIGERINTRPVRKSFDNSYLIFQPNVPKLNVIIHYNFKPAYTSWTRGYY